MAVNCESSTVPGQFKERTGQDSNEDVLKIKLASPTFLISYPTENSLKSCIVIDTC